MSPPIDSQPTPQPLSETARRELSEAAVRLLASGFPLAPATGLGTAIDTARAAVELDRTIDRHATITQKPDGTRVTERLDGTRISARLDGTVVREYADGSRVAESSDGWSVRTLRGRLEEVTYPDGAVRRFGYDPTTGRLNETRKIAPDTQGEERWRLSRENLLSMELRTPNRETIMGIAGFGLNQNALLTLPGLLRSTDAWRSDTNTRFITEDRTESNGDYSFVTPGTGDKVLFKADGTRIDSRSGDRVSAVYFPDGRSTRIYWDGPQPYWIRLPNGEVLESKNGEWQFKKAPSDPSIVPSVKEVQVHPNGDCSYKTDLGIKHIFRANGDHERVFGDNTRDVERPDGSRLITLDSEGKAKLIRHANGDSVRYDSNGQLSELDTKDGIWRKLEGGRWSYAKAAGDAQQAFAGQIAADGAGNCLVTGVNGLRTIYRNNGSRVQEFPAGDISTQTILKDGTTITQYRDGTSGRLWADKAEVKSDRSGRVLSIADGKGGTWRFGYAGGTDSLTSITDGNRTWTREGSSDKWRNEMGELRETQDVIPFGMVARAFITDNKQLSEFQHNSEVLERRLQTVPGLTPADARQELRKFRADLCRLLIASDADSNQDVDGKQVNPRIKHRDRILLAEELAQLSAFPTHTDQGYHGTCSITTVQTRLLHRSPSVVSRMIGDLALTSSYRTGDGTKIKYDASDPSLTFDGDRRNRLFVSQLFQVTATNSFWLNQEKDPDGNPVAKGTIRYRQEYLDREHKDGGERLINTATGKQIRDWSAINITRVREMSRHLTGRDENFAVAHVTRGRFDTVQAFETKEQLRRILVDMKLHHLLPASFSVSTGDKLFGGDKDSTMHAVSVIDFDEKTGLVSLDNQWGNANDYIGEPDTNPKIPLDRFYEATKDHSDEKKQKEKQG